MDRGLGMVGVGFSGGLSVEASVAGCASTDVRVVADAVLLERVRALLVVRIRALKCRRRVLGLRGRGRRPRPPGWRRVRARVRGRLRVLRAALARRARGRRVARARGRRGGVRGAVFLLAGACSVRRGVVDVAAGQRAPRAARAVRMVAVTLRLASCHDNKATRKPPCVRHDQRAHIPRQKLHATTFGP